MEAAVEATVAATALAAEAAAAAEATAPEEKELAAGAVTAVARAGSRAAGWVDGHRGRRGSRSCRCFERRHSNRPHCTRLTRTFLQRRSSPHPRKRRRTDRHWLRRIRAFWYTRNRTRLSGSTGCQTSANSSLGSRCALRRMQPPARGAEVRKEAKTEGLMEESLEVATEVAVVDFAAPGPVCGCAS